MNLMAPYPPTNPRPNFQHLHSYLLLLCYIISCATNAHSMNNKSNILCISKERESLLEFKQGIQIDYCDLLTSWGHDQHQLDCCSWKGVSCSSAQYGSHVIGLKLHGYQFASGYQICLQGDVSASLQGLKHLKYLDLSFNDFKGKLIPNFIGSLTNLEYLSLSTSGFHGEIPSNFGNLSKLESLHFNCDGIFCPTIKSLSWLTHLTLLKYVDLSGIDLSLVSNWFKIVNCLPNLKFLNMNDCSLSPKIVSSLSYINSSTTLSFLSLSDNKFHDSSAFQWLFNLSGIGLHLVHLDLSGNLLSGPIPNDFGKMHHLSYLDLSFNQLKGSIPVSFGNMIHLSYLDLSFNQLKGQIPSSFGSLHSLSHLSLNKNQLECPIPNNISTLKSLAYLELSGNKFQGSNCIPKNIGSNLCNLQELYLGNNSFTDHLSAIIQTLFGCTNKVLVLLDLSQNNISGSVPDMINTFIKLEDLRIGHNKLNGTISEAFGQLSMLQSLYLSYNSLKGTFSNKHLSNLSRLSNLYLSNNAALQINISADWCPPFQLYDLDMGNCMLGPHFPKWLLTQKNISWLDISNAGISDTIPAPFWNLIASNLKFLNVSHNMIHGILPDDMPNTFQRFPVLDLSSNNIRGEIPSFLVNSSSLFLNNNKFSKLMPFLCPKTITPLSFLDLSNNLFMGELPDCWMNFNKLSVLHLDNNRFSGSLPASFAAQKQLQALHLRNNSISGKLPSTLLENWTSLLILDLAFNSISGNIPINIGNSLLNLVALSLRKNNFEGELPSNLCHLPALQLLDLSGNHFSGCILKCIGNLTAMSNTATDVLKPSDNNFGYLYSPGYIDKLLVVWKRAEQSFGKNLGQIKAIDISHNKMEGHVPDGISSLIGLVFLNLSRNNFHGNVPSKIGQLTSLQFLDLSHNHISGEIPISLTQVTFLEILDISNNNLSGRIPTGTQLQGFDASAYSGNPRLCGPPLPKCLEDELYITTLNGNSINQHDKQDNGIFPGLYVSVLLGFIVGFLGAFGTLTIKVSWRDNVFKFLNEIMFFT